MLPFFSAPQGPSSPGSRSAVLLARFRYVQEDRFHTIKDVQKSNQPQEVPDIAIGEALKGEPDYR